MELGRYLKYGMAKEFTYGNVTPVIDIEWEEAKLKFVDNLRKSIHDYSYYDGGIAFCGTLSACLLAQMIDKRITTWSADIGIDTEKLSSMLNSENHVAPMQNLEEALIEVNKLCIFPRSSLEDVYAYSRQKHWSKSSRVGLCEGGTDYLLLNSSYNALMNLAIKRGDYSIKKAMRIANPDKIRMRTNVDFRSYTNLFNNLITIFNDDELYEFGFEPQGVDLKHDTLEDFLRATYEWGFKTVYKYRTSVIAKHFNFKTFSPFINDNNMVNFCLSLPIEMKFCLGRGKHILKESIPLPEGIEKSTINRIYPAIYKTIKPEMDVLTDKYLKDKKRIIFSHLDYDTVQKHLNHYLKAWNLLSLSIWMEIKNGKI